MAGTGVCSETQQKDPEDNGFDCQFAASWCSPREEHKDTGVPFLEDWGAFGQHLARQGGGSLGFSPAKTAAETVGQTEEDSQEKRDWK